MKITKNPNAKATIPEIRGSFANIRYPCFGEIKYDGEAIVISHNIERDITTTNKYGTMRSNWSKLNEIQTLLVNRGVSEAIFLGELFWSHGGSGMLYELLKHKTDDNLNIRIYDIAHLTTADYTVDSTTELLDRKEVLTDLFSLTDFIVRPEVMHNKDEARSYFKKVTNVGYEGIVLKMFDGRLTKGPCAWVKMKYKDRNEYTVVYVDPTLERIKVEVVVGVVGLSGRKVKVGCKCPNRYKQYVKVGDKVTIEHQGILPSGSLRHPVYVPPLTQ